MLPKVYLCQVSPWSHKYGGIRYDCILTAVVYIVQDLPPSGSVVFSQLLAYSQSVVNCPGCTSVGYALGVLRNVQDVPLSGMLSEC